MENLIYSFNIRLYGYYVESSDTHQGEWLWNKCDEIIKKVTINDIVKPLSITLNYQPKKEYTDLINPYTSLDKYDFFHIKDGAYLTSPDDDCDFDDFQDKV